MLFYKIVKCIKIAKNAVRAEKNIIILMVSPWWPKKGEGGCALLPTKKKASKTINNEEKIEYSGSHVKFYTRAVYPHVMRRTTCVVI